MKSVIISTILLALCITGSILATKAINQTSEEVGALCEQLLEYQESENLTAVQSVYQTIFDQWQGFRKLLFVCMNHEIVDNIELTMYKLEAMIQEKEDIHIKEYTVELLYQFDELSDTELLSLENIL